MRPTLLLLASALLAAAQAPVVGDINFYGLHKLTPEQILNAIHVKSGETLPPSKGELEDTLEKIPGVVLAQLEAVCCEGVRTILFVGVEERGAPHASFHSEPAGPATLPEETVDRYHQFLTAVQRSASRGNISEDLTAGHPMSADSVTRAFQEKFVSFAAEHLADLREILRNGAEPEQRAIAAALINYAANKADILNDLQYALQDPDAAVRSNAIRSLTAIAVLANRRPLAGLRISPTWFLELLNSVVLSDRVDSVKALLTLTDTGAAPVRQQILERSTPALAEMARWKTARYALPPFVLLGRAAGLSEDQIHQRWEKGDRESVIAKAIAAAPK